MNEKLSLTIITVVKNAEKTIDKTIRSVLNQIYYDFEFIIIDGLSLDNTLEIITSYKNIFMEKGIPYIVISEKDNGIYDAMNKGIHMARGKWVIFMNANDSFYSNNTLQEVFNREYEESIQCIYGDTLNAIEGFKYLKKAYPIETIYYRAPFVHQALFCKKELLEKYCFDTKYIYAADYDQFLRMYLDGTAFKYVEIVIACFDMSGISQNHCKEINEEWKIIQKSNNVYHRKYFRRKVRNIELLLKKNRYIYMLYLKTKLRRNPFK